MKRSLILIGLCLLGSVTAWAVTRPSEPIAQGWYDWADPDDRPVPPPALRARFAMSGTSFNARCLCAPGFEGRYAWNRETFTVTRAPDGYRDTKDKTFMARSRICNNCAD